ncbi:exodeoxyribonuclease VII large subunit, partial [Roseisolibacter sp. H3M3-2]|uniref:exodeoxyribonuclease VII large subunit n=1 Tax=Roseisolibacter sp. H3M3-2 TaxID=3031323 RepID=UPI0023DB3E6F
AAPAAPAVDPYARPTPEMEAFAAAAEAAGLTAASSEADMLAAFDAMAAAPVPQPGAIPGASPAAAVSVSTLTQTLKEVVEGAFVPLWVRGEVSDFKAHRNGHFYFCLRDQVAQVRCVMWARDARRLPATPDDGMQVVALGQVSVYAARGDLQVVVKALEAQGDGLWRKALDQTRAKLAADGLLDPLRKRPLPRYPRRVAVITSPDGAALHDVVAVARRRSPLVEIVVVPAKVQGDGAAEELRAAIERVGRWRDVDVVIVGRGGGAREDLWAFNDEQLARAVAACPVPVVSAVGHEVDVTLCDLVADLRAATPADAAEAVVPVLADVRDDVRALGEAPRAAGAWHLDRAGERLADVRADLVAGATRLTERRRAVLETAAGRLHALSPLATLGRGYAVARAADGSLLSRVADFPPGRAFALQVRDGTVPAAVRPSDA